MKKIKEFSKKYLIGFTLGLITSGIVVVCAATYFPSNQTTYDNSVSGLNATNVQTAIDELYNTCFPPTLGDQILEKTDLEKDPYECRYFFTGGNPNNYITFNNETWRIISVECDGTIKIIKDKVLTNRQWDSSNSNNWARPSSLNTYLNETYLTSTLNSTAQSQIVAKNWSIGAIPKYLEDNIGTQINKENSNKWSGKVALVTSSEYIRTNSNKNNCGTLALNEYNYSICKNTTWLYISNVEYWWALTPMSETNTAIFTFREYGSSDTAYANDTSNAVRPSVYLSSKIKITGGNGSSTDPYQISL